jgi:hypothetical protein
MVLCIKRGTNLLHFEWLGGFCMFHFICVCYFGIFQASDCDLPKFRNPLSVPSSKSGCRVHFILYVQPLKMELTEGSETSANHNLMPGKYPKEHLQFSKHDESLKSRIHFVFFKTETNSTPVIIRNPVIIRVK